MKLAALDWQQVLDGLPRWRALSPDARTALLAADPRLPIESHVLEPAIEELKAARVVIPPRGTGKRYKLSPSMQPLLVALGAVHRLRPLHAAGGVLDPEYLRDQLSPSQVRKAAGRDAGYYAHGHHETVAGRASSSDWVRGFLAAGTPAKAATWEKQLLAAGERPRLRARKVAEALRALVLALSSRAGGTPLHALPELLPDADRATRVAAVAAGLRYLLVFVSCDGVEDEPALGVLPAIAERLAPPPPPPAPVAVRETFGEAVRVLDMTAVLVEAATSPLPMRDDWRLYLRTQKALAAHLLPLPEWLERRAAAAGLASYEEETEELSQETMRRIRLAVEALMHLKLATVQHVQHRAYLAATAAGRAWLALPERDRLRPSLDSLRGAPQRNPQSWYGAAEDGDFFGAPLRHSPRHRTLDLREHLSAAFLATPAGAHVPLRAWTRHRSRAANPLLAPELARSRGGFRDDGLPITTDDWEAAWAGLLAAFLFGRLVPYGGAQVGVAEDGEVAFRLTGAGRYLLGGADDFEATPEAAEQLVVQPDFEVVFLAPAPRMEVEIGRFAERTGTGVGALFRITRASTLRAAEQGVTSRDVLETLGAASVRDVPANVARQIDDWMGAARKVRLRPAVLVECPDAETTLRIEGLARGQVTKLGPALLRLDAVGKARAALLKRLREKGIFVE
jgi:hypothetical protein